MFDKSQKGFKKYCILYIVDDDGGGWWGDVGGGVMMTMMVTMVGFGFDDIKRGGLFDIKVNLP